MEKFDVKVAHKALYSPGANEFTIVDVPAMQSRRSRWMRWVG